ncbi:hypothetical protein AB5I41_31120 [Sphingomonas sp. MMS24-JH45]
MAHRHRRARPHDADSPGTLTVFTGYANMGKSTVMNAVVGHLVLQYPGVYRLNSRRT